MLPVTGDGSSSGKIALLTGITGQVSAIKLLSILFRHESKSFVYIFAGRF